MATVVLLFTFRRPFVSFRSVAQQPQIQPKIFDLHSTRTADFRHAQQNLKTQTRTQSKMPTLKQISCSLELGSSTRLKEYDHRYTDGGVEAFVAVPDTQIPFHIRVTSSGYIAPGLAVYVFMDGAYQCNRNRQRLAMPGHGSNPSATETEVDFKLRQKEERTSEGLFVAREWTFAQLKTGMLILSD